MVKNGSNALKSRSRARAKNGGTTYQQAHPTSVQRPAAPRRARVIQFLAQHPYRPARTAADLAAAWAELGLRVLLLREPDPAKCPLFTMPWEVLDEPTDAGRVLWEQPHGSGCLVERRTLWWTHRGPKSAVSAASYDESPLCNSVDAARPEFDVIVLLDEGEYSPPRRAADVLVAVAYSDLPRTEPGGRAKTGQAPSERPLSPEQSGAVLRDRQLRAVQRGDRVVAGVVLVSDEDQVAQDAGFAGAVQQDMASAGIPLIGWINGDPGRDAFFEPELQGLTPPEQHRGFHETAQAILQSTQVLD